MILRIVLFGLIVVGLLGFGGVVWQIAPHHGGASAQEAPKILALTASHALRPGVLLKPEDLSSTEYAEGKLPEGAIKDDAEQRRLLSGALVRRALSQGDVLRLPGDVLLPGDHGFLAAVLSPGSRAVTVGVDAVSGTAGLLWPGDRVDVILTQTIDDPSVAPGRRIAAETVVSDVRVIAIDQQIAQGNVQGTEPNGQVKTVTLEVSPSHAEYIQVATRLGKLSLTLRAADTARGEDEVVPQTTWAGDVSAALPKATTQAPPSSIRVYQGKHDGKEYRF